ncbi:hypothetical protein [Phycicoccus sp. 3266]|uniref:3'-5' exonuclease n=1 Tax=Phycicoccus sp. 3266 TaxID=2817751 RepID=UPI002859FCC5|nr:hypothetical protein [Phycicoccus sp. 3266]MDR6861944.1 hypothetical protein [Phycicoccus sp. 3266]
MNPIVFLDTETDGLHAARRPWEIAMVRRDSDGTERTLTMYVALDLRDSDPKALQIGRFWDRHPSGRRMVGKSPSPGDSATVYSSHDAAKFVMEWTFGATIVGAVPSFDTEVLGRMLRHHGYLPSWNHRIRCVETMTAGYLGKDPGGLRDCADALSVRYEHDRLHTALGDATLARDIWDHLMAGGAR